MALVHLVTGSPRVTVRLPGLLAAIGCTLSVYDLGRRLWNGRVGLVAGLLFLAVIQSLLVLKAGQTDALRILERAVSAGHDRGRNLFLVDVRVDPGRCASQPIRRLYRFRWERPYR